MYPCSLEEHLQSMQTIQSLFPNCFEVVILLYTMLPPHKGALRDEPKSGCEEDY